MDAEGNMDLLRRSREPSPLPGFDPPVGGRIAPMVGSSSSPTSKTPRLLKQIRREAHAASKDDDVYVLRCKRSVRTTSEADSSKLGELQVGALLRIVERAELPDGTKRVRIARYNRPKPLGWITNLGRRETVEALSAFHWMRFQRSPQQQRSKSTSGRLEDGVAEARSGKPVTPRVLSRRATRRRAAPRVEVLSDSGSTISLATGGRTAAPISGESSSSRQHALTPQNVVATRVRSEVSPATGLPVATSSTRPVTGAALSTSAGTHSPEGSICAAPGTVAAGEATDSATAATSPPKLRGAQGDAADSDESFAEQEPRAAGANTGKGSFTRRATGVTKLTSGKNGSTARSSKGEHNTDAQAESFTKKDKAAAFLPASVFTEAVEEQIKKAEAVQAGLHSKELPVQIGQALQQKWDQADDKQGFIAALMRDWDPNRDGVISKMEFRQNVRKLVPQKHDAKDVDTLFDKLDLDRSGELEIPELKTALRTLMDSAAEAAVNSVAIKERADKLFEKAARTREVERKTLLVEQVEREVREYQKKSVGAQLGTILTKKAMKVSDIVSQWGGQAGLVDAAEFRKQVALLGLTAGPHEVNSLFKMLDDDGGGTLDQSEIKSAFRKLADECETVKASTKRLNSKFAEVLKAAKAAQADWKQERVTEQREAEEEEVRLAHQAQAKAEAVQRAKAAKLAVAAEKKAEEERQKQEFEARVALRRQQTSKTPLVAQDIN
jgi:Ca2+-binding EF-hand superfamily protein